MLANALRRVEKGGASALMDTNRELDQLVKAIGECKSKAEEDRIIGQEVEVLKQRLNDPRLDKSRGREYMVRVMYCEMLGHDASFAYIHCLQFASDAAILTKKAAYLALTQLLDHNNELVLLLVNTLLSDLKSDNFIIVASALTVCTRLIGGDLINAVLPVVTERLQHPKETVRKKAIMALLHFHRLDPHRTGALQGVDLDRPLRTMLCDKDPGVMSAALCALQVLVAQDPAAYRNLIPSFTSILKQVSEHRLPKSYDYHRFPAPFIQVKLLKILASLGAGDKGASDNMYTVIQQALKRAHGGHTIGNAIIYEAVRTITTIHPSPQLLAAAAESVSVLLRSNSHNLKYVGLDALGCIVKVSPKYAQEHQIAVIDCLEDPDDTLKLKTLDLLYRMTKANNVEVIVGRMMDFLRSSSDEHLRREICGRVAELAERYAPSTTWFITVMAEVFELGGELIDPKLPHNLMRLIAEQDEELHATAVDIFLTALLERSKLPDVLLQTVAWVLGEYGSLAAGLQGPNRLTPVQVIERLCNAVSSSGKPSASTRAYLLSAVLKLAAQCGCGLPPDAEELLVVAGHSSATELQQRAQEARALLSGAPGLAAAVLPPDASCEEFEPSEVEAVQKLSFLDSYVQGALSRGAEPYNPALAQRGGLVGNGHSELEDALLLSLSAAGASTGHSNSPRAPHALRFDAYERQTAPAAPITAAAPAAASAAAYGSEPQLYGAGGGGWGGAAPAAATAAAPQPQLALKAAAAGPRRWGPTDYAATAATAAGGSSGVQAATAAAPSTPPGGGRGASSVSPSAAAARGMSEKDRLAASIFGDGSGTTAAAGSRFQRPAANSTTPRSAAAARPPPTADLLGDDLPAPTASQAAPAAAPAAGPGTASGIDLLGDFSEPAGPPVPAPAAAAPTGAAAAAGRAAAAAASPMDDLLGGFMAPAVAAAPSATGAGAGVPSGPGAAAPAASQLGGSLLDLDALYSSGPPQVQLGAAGGVQPGYAGAGPSGGGPAGFGHGPGAAAPGQLQVQQQQQQQGLWPQQPGMAQQAGTGMAAAKAQGPMAAGQAGRGRPAASPVDPFKDLLG